MLSGGVLIDALAGHVSNHHGRGGRRARSERPKGDTVCPLCAHPPPLGAEVLVRSYMEEGLSQEQATGLTAKVLRASPSALIELGTFARGARLG